MRLVVIVGNPKPQSRTLATARAAADAIVQAARLPGGYQMIDLSVLARRLLAPEPPPAVEQAIGQLTSADLVLAASPTFKGTYSGLLKVFLDLLPHRGLERAIALPLLVMKLPQHAAAVDVHLRPLLAELGATVPVPGLAILEPDLGSLDSVLRPWAARVAMALGEPAPAAEIEGT